MRLSKMETIVDMFAGLGYFTIPLSSGNRDKIVKYIAIEKNPVSFGYLKQNLVLNSVNTIVEAVNGDNRIVASELIGTCDRILMGYLPNTKDFLPRSLFSHSSSFLRHILPLHLHDHSSQWSYRSSATLNRDICFLGPLSLPRRMAAYSITIISPRKVKPKPSHLMRLMRLWRQAGLLPHGLRSLKLARLRIMHHSWFIIVQTLRLRLHRQTKLLIALVLCLVTLEGSMILSKCSQIWTSSVMIGVRVNDRGRDPLCFVYNQYKCLKVYELFR